MTNRSPVADLRSLPHKDRIDFKISTGTRSRPKVSAAFPVIIGICMLLFEAINYSSSFEAFQLMWNNRFWSMLLAGAFVLVDFGGLARLFMGDTTPQTNQALWPAWVLTAVGDASLTYLPLHFVMLASSNHIMVTSGTISLQTWTNTIPWMIAFLIMLIEFTLVVTMNKIIDGYLRRKGL